MLLPIGKKTKETFLTPPTSMFCFSPCSTCSRFCLTPTDVLLLAMLFFAGLAGQIHPLTVAILFTCPPLCQFRWLTSIFRQGLLPDLHTEKELYDEWVIIQSNQVLPAYIIEIDKNCFPAFRKYWAREEEPAEGKPPPSTLLLPSASTLHPTPWTCTALPVQVR